MAEARERGVVVEMNLFCPFYEEVLWDVNPMNARNNVNGVGTVPRDEVYTLKHADLTAIQEAVVRKIVTELNGFDNVYFEVSNEPYFGGITLEWQHHVAALVAGDGGELPRRHLVSMNIANGTAKVETPSPHVSIFNFHYATPPDAVAANAHLARRDRRERDGLPRERRRPLPHRGLGFPARRRGPLQQPRLLVHAPAHPDGTFLDYTSRAAGARRSGGSCGCSRTSSTRSSSSG